MSTQIEFDKLNLQDTITDQLVSSLFCSSAEHASMPRLSNDKQASATRSEHSAGERPSIDITIMVVGPSQSGKSAFINRIVFDTFVDKHEVTFQDEYRRTVTVNIRHPKLVVTEFMSRHANRKDFDKHRASSKFSHRGGGLRDSARKQSIRSSRHASVLTNTNNLYHLQQQIRAYDDSCNDPSSALSSSSSSAAAAATPMSGTGSSEFEGMDMEDDDEPMFNVDDDEGGSGGSSSSTSFAPTLLLNDETMQGITGDKDWTEVETVDVRVTIVDTTGSEDLQNGAMKEEFSSAVGKSDGYILVYDASDAHSLERLQSHYYQKLLFLSEAAPDNVMKSFTLVGNKNDLAQKSPQRDQITKNAEGLARYFFIGEHPLDTSGIPLFETNAKEVRDVPSEHSVQPENLFSMVVTRIVERKMQRKLIELTQNNEHSQDSIDTAPVLFNKKSIYHKFQRVSRRMEKSRARHRNSDRKSLQQKSVRMLAKMVHDSGVSQDDFAQRHSMKIPQNFLAAGDTLGERSRKSMFLPTQRSGGLGKEQHHRPKRKNFLVSFKKMFNAKKSSSDSNSER